MYVGFPQWDRNVCKITTVVTTDKIIKNQNDHKNVAVSFTLEWFKNVLYKNTGEKTIFSTGLNGSGSMAAEDVKLHFPISGARLRMTSLSGERK